MYVMWLVVLVLTTWSLPGCSSSDYRMSCYYRWLHRDLKPGFLKQNLVLPSRKSICTHIIVSFATVGDDFRLNLTDVGKIEGLKRFIHEGRPTPTTKMMLSIGGGNGHGNFDQLVANESAVDIFQESVEEVFRLTGLDGLDIDWEFPSLLQKDSFGQLLDRTRQTLDRVQKSRQASNSTEFASGKQDGDRLELSVALPGPFTLSSGYSIAHLKNNCTFMNVMTYDLVLYSPFFPLACFHNALYGQSVRLFQLHLLAVKFSMTNWVNLGLPKNMLLEGIPTYGVAYELADPKKTYPPALINGYSSLGHNLNYDHICKMEADHPNNVRFDEKARVPYVHDGKGNWVTYDNPQSVSEKAAFAVHEGYGGVMVFSLNADDPSGRCAGVRQHRRNNETASSQEDDQYTDLADSQIGEPFPLTKIIASAYHEAREKQSKQETTGSFS